MLYSCGYKYIMYLMPNKPYMLCYVTLRYTVLRYFTLHCVALHYVTLRYVKWIIFVDIYIIYSLHICIYFYLYHHIFSGYRAWSAICSLSHIRIPRLVHLKKCEEKQRNTCCILQRQEICVFIIAQCQDKRLTRKHVSPADAGWPK